ncbi:MAG TPA: hypothetical protein VNP73_01310 [Actinomycetota bacterium]|nr:hypothetical protein [Actinomycetota bacterium]
MALVLSLSLIAACSDTGPDAGDRTLLGTETPRAGKDKGKKPGGKNAERKKGGNNRGSGSAGKDGGTVAGGPSALPEQVDVPGADEDKTYPTASAEIVESKPDGNGQGITPGYAELLGTRVEGLGKDFRVTLTFNGEVPQEMPNDKSIMVIGFQVLRGRDDGYAFSGQATEKGWQPYAGGKEKATDFPGRFEVSGSTIVMEIPWSYVEGAYPFKWLVTSNWYQSLANTTHYIFDLIPNKGQANYPG